MANQATTTYKVTGTRKAVNDLWSTLQKMEVNSKNIWLYQLAEHYGIDYETKQISVRGHIYWAEYEEDPANEHYLLSFETETAWDACNELFEEINLKPRVSSNLFAAVMRPRLPSLIRSESGTP